MKLHNVLYNVKMPEFVGKVTSSLSGKKKKKSTQIGLALQLYFFTSEKNNNPATFHAEISYHEYKMKCILN